MPIEYEVKPATGSLTETSSGNNYVPYNTYYHDNRFQFVLLATELQAAGLRLGDRIIAVKFQCGTSVPGRNLVNFRIRMQNSDMTSSTAWVTSGWSLVFGPATISETLITANSWQQHNFIEPFVWDGRNLLIDVSRDDTAYTNGGGMYVYTGLSVGRACGLYHDSDEPWPYDGLTPDVLSFIPRTVLVVDSVLTATLEPQAASLSASIPAPHVVSNAATVTSPALIAQIAIPHQNLYLYPIVAPSVQISLSFIPPLPAGHARVAASGAAVSTTMPRAAASAAVRVSAVPSVQAEPRPPQVYARVLPFLNLRTKSKPIVYDQSGKRLAILENAHDIVLTQEINGEDTLTFMFPATDPKAVYVANENHVKIAGAEYIIRRIENTHDVNGKQMSVYCEAPWYDLMFSAPLTVYEWTNATPNVPMHDILSGTGWTPGVVEITSYRTLNVDQATTNRLAALRQVTIVWGGELEFDTTARMVHLRREISRKPGIIIAFRKNIRSVHKITDTSDLITRLYAYGKNGLTISDVNNGAPYVENFQYTTTVRVGVWKDTRFVDPYALKERAEEILVQLSKPRASYVVKAVDLSALSGFEHESFRLGDYVIVYDEELGAKIETRIVRWQYHVDEPWKTEIELSTRVPRLSDYMYDADDATKTLAYDLEDRLQDLEERSPSGVAYGDSTMFAYCVPANQTVALKVPFWAEKGSWAILHVMYAGAVSNAPDADVEPIETGSVIVLNSSGRLAYYQMFNIIVSRYPGGQVGALGSTTVYIPSEKLDGIFAPGTIMVTTEIDPHYVNYYRHHSVQIVWQGTINVSKNGTQYQGDCLSMA